MKLLFASDLHGSAYYAEKLEELIRNEAPDKTVLLGDLLYHGSPDQSCAVTYNHDDLWQTHT